MCQLCGPGDDRPPSDRRRARGLITWPAREPERPGSLRDHSGSVAGCSPARAGIRAAGVDVHALRGRLAGRNGRPGDGPGPQRTVNGHCPRSSLPITRILPQLENAVGRVTLAEAGIGINQSARPDGEQPGLSTRCSRSVHRRPEWLPSWSGRVVFPDPQSFDGRSPARGLSLGTPGCPGCSASFPRPGLHRPVAERAASRRRRRWGAAAQAGGAHAWPRWHWPSVLPASKMTFSRT